MSDFKAKPLFQQIEEGLKGMDDKEKKDIQKKVSVYAAQRKGTVKRSCVPFKRSSQQLFGHGLGGSPPLGCVHECWLCACMPHRILLPLRAVPLAWLR